MMVHSPLKQQKVKSNLRKMPDPEKKGSSSKNGRILKNTRAKKESENKGSAIKPGRVIFIAFLIGVLGFVYLTHVFATQRLLKEVQLLENEYNNARQMHDELKLKYDRMVGPAEIYEKAKDQGFVNGGPADKVLVIENE